MTIDEMIRLLKTEQNCVERAKECDRQCNKCDLVQDDKKLIQMYDEVINVLGIYNNAMERMRELARTYQSFDYENDKLRKELKKRRKEKKKWKRKALEYKREIENLKRSVCGRCCGE